MKIAILSNFTTGVLEGMLKNEHRVWSPAGFAAWMETALLPPDDLKVFAPDLIYLLLDRHFEGARPWTAEELSQARKSLSSVFPKVPVVVPDIAAIASDFGNAFYDSRMWRLGKMPFSAKGLKELGKLFGVKKVLALDLDNTLWKGVIGEDGAAGVVPDAVFQKEIKDCKKRGAVLVALSKNNREDVEPIWKDRRMILRKEDFTAFGINWEDKAVNLAGIAEDINLGTDSFVFIDDDPAERSQMRAMRPEVCVAEFPPALGVYFPRREPTAEDVLKTAQYQAEAARKNSAAGLSIDEYLKNLEIVTEIHPVRDEEIPRVAQLSQKTNQFNVRTNRLSEEDVRAFIEDSGNLIVTAHCRDRFGDLGLIAFVRVQGGEILDWVMSCRAMNRRIEFDVEREVERLLIARGITRMKATWSRTARNAPVEGLFESFGFSIVSESEDFKSYVRELETAESAADGKSPLRGRRGF